MAWLAPNNRPMKNVEFYQRKALSFLFSAEGKDEIRALNIPFAQLGFYSPLHFLSLIPEELCEPYKNDRLFLASSGTVRKGDKVLLLEKGTEGIIKSAVFKERRVRKNGEIELLLDGHRRAYSEEEVVPYKTQLRQHLGTSLVPENNYVITEDGILDWEKPTWEPGQEVYYKPEKRWATVLSRDEHPKGKTVVFIKLDGNQVKREKTTTIPLKELMADAVPLRVPRRVQGGSAIASSSGRSSMDDQSIRPNMGSNMEISDRRPHAMMLPHQRDDNVHSVIENRNRDERGSDEVGSPDSSRGETIYAEVLPRQQPRRTPRAKDKGMFSFATSFLRKKPSKHHQRPTSEYYPSSPSDSSQKENRPSHQDQEPSKSKSCHNLNASISDEDDDDMDQYEMKNYTNSLRSSARKIIQKQLARDSTRSASLKASSNPSSSRPHVAEIFTLNNNTLPKPNMDNSAEEDMPIKPIRSKHLKRLSSMDNYSSNDNSHRQGTSSDAVDYTKKPSIYSPTMMIQANAMAAPPPSTITHQYSRAPIMSTTHEPYSRSSPLPSTIPSYLLTSYSREHPHPSTFRLPPVQRGTALDSRSTVVQATTASYLSSSPIPAATTSYMRQSPVPAATTSYLRQSPPTATTSYLRQSPPAATTSYLRQSPVPPATTSYLRQSPPAAHTSYMRQSPVPPPTISHPVRSPAQEALNSYMRSSPVPATSYSRPSPIPPATTSQHPRSSPIPPSVTPKHSRSPPLDIVTSSYSSTSPVSMIIQQYNNAAGTSSPPPPLPTSPPPTSPVPPSIAEIASMQQPSRRFNHRPLPTLDYLRQKPSPNPLDYDFAPLSSSELVKKQIATTTTTVNRVMYEPENNMSSDYVLITPPTKVNEHPGIYSDSSSHDNDSGRGSYQYTADIDKMSPVKKNGCDVIYNSSPKTRRHPSFEHSSSSNPDIVDTTDKSGTINNNLQKRYTKNRSLSKHAMSKNTHNNEELDNEEEYKKNMPHPFNPSNLSHVAGYGKGIQGTANSSFADATLFALFACSNIFDRHLLFSKPGQLERGLKRDVRTILCNKIVTPLRLNAYCKSENITHLREAMLPLSSKMHSSLMDAEEFLYLLLDSALNIESFMELSNGSKDYMHQIIARPKDRSKSQTVQFMLETSLGTSGQKFKRVPMPALFLCMPRCKGRLVYYEAIIPSLQLNITRLLHQGPKQCVCEMAATLECSLCHRRNGDIALDFCDICKGIADQIHFRLDHSPVLVPKSQKDEMLNLHSIVCARGNRYVAFVKASEQRLSPWLFFDPMAGDFPEVTLLEDFGRWLDSLEKQPGSFREFAKLHPLLKRVMTDGHIYIYSKSHVADGRDLSESFAI